MALIYLRVPQDEVLASRSGWQAEGDDTFIAVQAHIAGVPVREAITRKGPATEVIRLPSGVEYTAEVKRIHVEKYTEEITDSIERTMTTKFAAEVSAKLASEIGVSAPLSSAKLSAEVQAKSGIELTNAVRRSLASRRSFEAQISQEVRRSMTYPVPRDTILQFHLEYWPWRWEFYLYRVELLRLRYQHYWVWPDVRETVERRVVQPNLPLFAVTFYEPQDTQSVTFGDYVPDVTDGDVIKVEPLTTATPPTLNGPPGQSLEDLARLAFPTTRAERRKARAGRKAGRKAAAKKAAPKKAASKKAAPKKGMKKAAAKKAGRKAAPKKAGRKAVAKKAAPKKSAAKKAGRKAARR